MNALFATYKPAGVSSNHFLMKLKRKYQFLKCGYSGTLDPFASGLLLVGVGSYTKLFDYLDKSIKSYETTLWLGVESESLDIERIESVKCVKELDRDRVNEILKSFIGKIKYIPPKFSAKHIKGKRAYELARSGIEFELQECEMEIFAIELLSYNHPFISFRVEVSEGAYIRSLGEMIAQRLGVKGALSALKRVGEGSVKIEREKIKQLDIFSHLTPKRISLDEYKCDFKNGKKIKLKNQNLLIHTPYLVIFDDFFSIIEINKNQEVKYRLNRMPRC
ncbi:tRNA pseudouridine(55) synthase TruB [Helicobacter cholecystus]|uniref:tRNA pseudouridine(55) synthase TruB n=1 Tax=Helicobacter cholecystus TaxID=45498 RepID=UPI002738EA2F|nr:tRNA pseudouridine(55) synthase TruB [Helicobacter cholecystus]